jgi:hypothetical protein
MSSKQGLEKLEPFKQAIDAFIKSPETDPELSKSCFWELKGAYADWSKRIARWFTIAIVLMCTFELINLGLIDKASVAFIEITRISFLVYILPPAVTFTFVQVFAVVCEQTVYQELMLELAGKKFPGLIKSGIRQIFIAQAGVLSADIPTRFTPRSRTVLDAYFIIQALVIIGGYIAFEVYAYWHLFSHTYSHSISIISLCATAFLFILLMFFIRAVVGETITERERMAEQSNMP